MKLITLKFILVALAFLLVLFPSSAVVASSITGDNIFRIINSERTKRGIKELKIDVSLSRAANLKSRDMINRDYFEHYAYGLSPWDFINNSGYNYWVAGENLAMDFNTAEGAVRAWMDSPSHRDNILNSEYEDLGIGIVKGAYDEDGRIHSTIMLTTMFGKKKSRFINIFDSLRKLLPLS